MDKFNPFYIIKAHFNTLNSNYCEECMRGNKEISYNYVKREFLLFFGLPLLVILFLFYNNKFLTLALCGSLIDVFSISIPLLLSLLVFVYDMIKKVESDNELTGKTKTFKLCIIKETSDNISFSVLISIIQLVLIVLLVIFDFKGIYLLIFSGLIFYFSCWLILTMLIILKRIHFLISSELQF